MTIVKKHKRKVVTAKLANPNRGSYYDEVDKSLLKDSNTEEVTDEDVKKIMSKI